VDTTAELIKENGRLRDELAQLKQANVHYRLKAAKISNQEKVMEYQLRPLPGVHEAFDCQMQGAAQTGADAARVELKRLVQVWRELKPRYLESEVAIEGYVAGKVFKSEMCADELERVIEKWMPEKE